MPRVRFARATEEEFTTVRQGERSGDGWFACHELEDGSTYLCWSELFEFLVDPSGSCVRYRPLREGDLGVLQNFLFGQALAFALIRQNIEPVHAAVVDVGGFAIALLGDCTYGKSTLAGSLVQAGCRLVSDDLLVIAAARGGMVARAGAGRIKLLPDSARAVFGAARTGARIIANANKRVFHLDDRLVQRNDVPLRAFVVLPTPKERDECGRFELLRITGAQVFQELLRNTFVRYVHDSRRLQQNFSWNAQLASAIDGYQLRYPTGIDRLPEVATATIDHFRSHSQKEPQ